MAINYGTTVRYIGENQIYRDHGIGVVDGIIETEFATVVLVKYRSIGIKLKYFIDDLEEVKEEKKVTITESQLEKIMSKKLVDIGEALAHMLIPSDGDESLFEAVANIFALFATTIDNELFGSEDGD
ncbi:hypothetical protein [Jeotgalibaca porci]|uniref:hypothetical protein n=1 Tax=Jeotgalibaca porci TaxID=1868793 RepID=UPI0035A192D2